MSSGLELRSVSHSFGGTDVLHDVSLTVPPSGCVALLGASGSGKSTVLRIIAGLDRPSAGQVLVDGDDMGAVHVEQRGMALVFQNALLFPHLNVIDNVAFPARMAGQRRAEARRHAMEYLELVQLADYAHRPVGKLSGGQEQRVALARALARNPRILLLDEPFASLDVQLREDMYDLIQNIRAQLAPTIVVVTHDRQEASILADSIAVLDEGRILQHGTVHQLHYEPATQMVNRLLGGLNAVPGHVSGGKHHSVLGQLPVQDTATDGPAFLIVRQEALRLIPPREAGSPTLKGSVSGITSLGARTLVRVSFTSGDPNPEPNPLAGKDPRVADLSSPDLSGPDGYGNGLTATLTVDVAGNPHLLLGQVVGVGLQEGRAWAVQA
ncbi:ABC transporter ATP-binding protein [Arthrobacter cheniae]|uniref:ABC-type quaternary amine transporter n=1 Tax=Arthrobacter cheniae TaxID=1258888 RepID=A0A3A5M692_9MICC|nr:ABC transporter ATP-binding protein [Arthrobacter cheniae]RJT81081.1 ABC transporter ATP-binding protein [Arthrobacter cheniae]